MEEEVSRFVRQTRRRNVRETVAGLALLLAFAFGLFSGPDSRLAMIGCAVGVLAMLFVIAVIWSRLHIPSSDLGTYPPGEHPEMWRRHMTSQAKLLRLAWLWYVLPLGVGIALLVAGTGDGFSAGRAVFLAIVLAGAVGVARLNVKAAQHVEGIRDALVGPPLGG